ncbi:unnamed protein product [Mytilus edulis]|uniref:Uncharacterized protein n=1 Tax=Mytilus edulis TaxID=6550 RepID=A0A8S3UKE0_MYTED|nr:unnamed protein product [Mytilus edulis]
MWVAIDDRWLIVGDKAVWRDETMIEKDTGAMTRQRLQGLPKRSDTACGVAIDDRWLIVGDKAVGEMKLHLIEKDTGAIVGTTAFTGLPKRLCYDFHVIKFSFHVMAKTVFLPQYMKIQLKSHIKSPSKGNNKALNGMNIHNGDMIFTTKEKEIKRTTLEGQIIYCYKNEAIVTPECLVVLPSGLVLFVDRNGTGSLHVLSCDGAIHRTLLENFEQIENPMDIWRMWIKKTVYIAGGEYIEVYTSISCIRVVYLLTYLSI